MARSLLFLFAVVVLYGSGFLYHETGPVVYSLVSLATLSIPLLFKLPFWKKVLLLLPLFITKVVGKYLLLLFGRNAMTAVMSRYGLLEQRWRTLLGSIRVYRLRLMARWLDLPRDMQAWLILIFLPVAIGIAVLLLVIEIFRMRMFRIATENALGRVFNRLARWFRE